MTHYERPSFNTMPPRQNRLLMGNNRHAIAMDDPRWSNKKLTKSQSTTNTSDFSRDLITDIYDSQTTQKP